eukprot:TRINITY_DN849_c0_g1_i1.p1 TRINITY_DN849_c0_g1~~TRINITY_DN849_c0_g1_i1.p1  ORF type:complete len:739 (+),score=159.67 TRINITY_DN849_c0_g1_i1:62-2278(+)
MRVVFLLLCICASMAQDPMNQGSDMEEPTTKKNEKIETDGSKPATDESKPATDESKPATDESKPATDESKPATDESQNQDETPPPPPPRQVTVTNYCVASPPKPKSKDGMDYRGCTNITQTGKACINWNASIPGFGVRAGKNYCRNANGRRSIWCRTGPEKNDWDFCDVRVPCGEEVCTAPQCEWPLCIEIDGKKKCVKENRIDDTLCDDGNPATFNDMCKAGTCRGVSPCDGLSCDNHGQCRELGSCIEPPSPKAGLCSYINKPDRKSCDDGSDETTEDMCIAGICLGSLQCGGEPCTATPCKAPKCEDGKCTHVPLDDGTLCDDNNILTQHDTCKAGVCKGMCLGRDNCGGELGEGDGDCSESNTCGKGLKCGALGSCSKLHAAISDVWPVSTQPYRWDMKDACCIKDEAETCKPTCEGHCAENLPSKDVEKCGCTCDNSVCIFGGDFGEVCCAPTSDEYAAQCTSNREEEECMCASRCNEGEESTFGCQCSCSSTCMENGGEGIPCCHDYGACLEMNTDCKCETEHCGKKVHPTCGCSCSMECRMCGVLPPEQIDPIECSRCCDTVEADCGAPSDDDEKSSAGSSPTPFKTTGPKAVPQCSGACSELTAFSCSCQQFCALDNSCCHDKVASCGGVATLETCTCADSCGTTAACKGCSCSVGCRQRNDCCPDFPEFCESDDNGDKTHLRRLTNEEKAANRIRRNMQPEPFPWQLLAIGIVAVLILVKGRKYIRTSK